MLGIHLDQLHRPAGPRSLRATEPQHSQACVYPDYLNGGWVVGQAQPRAKADVE